MQGMGWGYSGQDYFKAPGRGGDFRSSHSGWCLLGGGHRDPRSQRKTLLQPSPAMEGPLLLSPHISCTHSKPQ